MKAYQIIASRIQIFRITNLNFKFFGTELQLKSNLDFLTKKGFNFNVSIIN